MNDVSWRDLQRRHGGQWHKGKSLDGTCPMGPWIVTADASSPTHLRVSCRVNGVTKQDSNTKFLYFKLPRLIARALRRHDPRGGRHHLHGHPRRRGLRAHAARNSCKPGDLLETEIEGIGVMRNPIG